jgi:glycosyltransferase involved in cell wall biosynthesis
LLPKLASKCLKNGFTQVKMICNASQKYCNTNWNKGVKEATGDYIAIINSDIEFQKQDWDSYLIKNIDGGVELANPYEQNHVYNKPYGMPPINSFLQRYNIRGCCFMMSKELAKRVFPIPKQLTHWFGDNWIARGAKSYCYDRKVVVYHYISKSGEKVDQLRFWNIVYNDCLEYEKLTKDYIEPIKQKCIDRIRENGGDI